jgi:hypothetical protein
MIANPGRDVDGQDPSRGRRAPGRPMRRRVAYNRTLPALSVKGCHVVHDPRSATASAHPYSRGTLDYSATIFEVAMPTNAGIVDETRMIVGSAQGTRRTSPGWNGSPGPEGSIRE